jgi:hypothetical protein
MGMVCAVYDFKIYWDLVVAPWQYDCPDMHPKDIGRIVVETVLSGPMDASSRFCL